MSLSYQWLWEDTSAPIVGATSAIYDPVVGDIGHTPACDVSDGVVTERAVASGPVTAAPPPAGSSVFTAVDSPWNQRIAPGQAKDPNSDTWMAFVRANLSGNIWINSNAWSPFVYSVDTTRPADIAAGWGYHDSYGWYHFIGGGCWKQSGLPLSPSMATPWKHNNTVSDNPVYILDETTGIWYSVAGLHNNVDGIQPNGDWLNDFGSAVGGGHVAGSGFWDNGTRDPIVYTGGGSLDVAGIVHLHELQAGVISHALKCALPSICHRGPYDAFDGFSPTRVRYPATRSDGSAADNASAPPYGCRYRLAEAFDINAFTTDLDLRTFLTALQWYGAYDTDSAGGGTMSFAGSAIGSLAYPWRPGGPVLGPSRLSTIYETVISGILPHIEIVPAPTVSAAGLESITTIGIGRYTLL